MQKSVLIVLISLVAVARSNRELRWPPAIPCSGDSCEERVGDTCDDDCCRDPCPGCAEGLEVEKTCCSPSSVQEVYENTVLECDYPDSGPIQRIEFNGSLPYETTCLGLWPGKLFEPEIYTLVLNDNGRERRVTIGGDYQYITSFNQGNVLYYEEAQLKGCQCAGSTLKGFYAVVTDNPLTDCCSRGMSHESGVYGVVQLFSSDPDCCATCRMVQTSVTYTTPVNNQGEC